MGRHKTRADMKITDFRVLVKMWIYYCSDDKNDSSERVRELMDQHSVGWFLLELDNYIMKITCKD